jgi:hypothetical protein
MLEPGRYSVCFPRAQQDAFTGWLRAHSADVRVWSHETVFADSGPKARTCTVRFAVHSPVDWGALPAPVLVD